MMKKRVSAILLTVLMIMMSALGGCGNENSDPGTPPEDVIHPDASDIGNSEPEGGNASVGSGEIMEHAVTVRIGRDSTDEFAVNMIDNIAANTMLGYLDESELLFPTYTYDEEAGFVGQEVRGNYTRDEEVTVGDIKCGELYLFSDGQLRLYMKDVPGANITATPVGAFADASMVEDAVKQAYESNKGDSWGVEVYFWITKN